MKNLAAYDMDSAIAQGEKMKVGDLVRFRDVSSGSSWGAGSFSHFDGLIGILVELSTGEAGNPMATFVSAKGKERFNVLYFEALNESR
tara:strand:+ start:1905 stop:2168 length:264 start_codon:yes stop_codon:yes gene_type:complete